jgi:DNA-directed RNA polymerase specialized sigma24 family protein
MSDRDRVRVMMLVERYRGGDREAGDALLRIYARTLDAEARDYARAGLDVDDMRQEAARALLRAAETFVENKGTNIDTYVKRCMRRALIDQQRHATRRRFGQHADVDDRDTVAEPVATASEDERAAEMRQLMAFYDQQIARLADAAASDRAHALHQVVLMVASRMVLDGAISLQAYQGIVQLASDAAAGQFLLFAVDPAADARRGAVAALSAMLGQTLRAMASGHAGLPDIAAAVGVDVQTARLLRRAVRALVQTCRMGAAA